MGAAGKPWLGLGWPPPYFRKSTTFDPPSAATVQQWNITWEPSVYDQGPLHITIPDFLYPDVALVLGCLEACAHSAPARC